MDGWYQESRQGCVVAVHVLDSLLLTVMSLTRFVELDVVLLLLSPSSSSASQATRASVTVSSSAEIAAAPQGLQLQTQRSPNCVSTLTLSIVLRAVQTQFSLRTGLLNLESTPAEHHSTLMSLNETLTTPLPASYVLSCHVGLLMSNRFGVCERGRR